MHHGCIQTDSSNDIKYTLSIFTNTVNSSRSVSQSDRALHRHQFVRRLPLAENLHYK